MKEPLTFTPEAVGQRLDKWLAEQNTLDLTRSVIQTRMEQGDVTVNGASVSKNYKIRSGDVVQVVIPEPVSLELVPEPIPLDIVYEDDDLLVVNKPKGMVVHPAPGNLTGTLVHALLYHCGDRLSGINGVIRPGIVHRIDKNTSGLLMVAKNDHAHLKLSEQIQAHTFTRAYQAIAVGRFSEKSGKKCVSHRKIPRMPLHIIPCWRSPATIRICNYSSKQAEPIKFGCIWHIWGIQCWAMTCMESHSRT